MNRRRFVKIAAGAGALALGGRAWYFGARETWALRVVRVEVPVPRLPMAFDGLKIAHLSDLHVCPKVSPEYVSRALQMVEPLAPQVIVLTGDYVSRDWPYMQAIVPALSRLRAPLGVYAVLGNHDYYFRRQLYVSPLLGDAGVTLLRNESRRLGPEGSGLYIAGVDDPITGHDDVSAAMGSVPADACTIVLAHTPDVVPTVRERGGDLLLAGHTHGGQVCIPFYGPPVVPSVFGMRFAAGLASYEGTAVFVTRGVGVVEPCVRFHCPPEVALLTLRSADWPVSKGGPEVDMRPQVKAARKGVQVLRRLKRELAH